MRKARTLVDVTDIEATDQDAARSSLRAQKKESTRIALAEAALRLCQARGYTHVTVSDIVDEVGVSRRTFSNYFTGKAECLVSIVDGQLDDLIAQFVPESSDEDAVVEIKRTLAATPTDFWQKCTALSAMVNAEPELQAFSHASDQRSIDYVAQEVAERLRMAPDDLRLRITISAVVVCVKECVNRWLTTGPKGDTGALVRLIIDNLDVVNTEWIDDVRRLASTSSSNARNSQARSSHMHSSQTS